MAIKLPLLSSKAYPKTPSETLDMLLAHALASDYSQSEYFHGKVTSIAYIVATKGRRPVALFQSMRQALELYLEKFYVALEVSVKEMAIPGLNPDGNRYGLEIAITALDSEGQRVNLAKGYQVGDGMLSELGKQE